MHNKGYGTQIDYPRAIGFYTKACNRKHASACYNLGALYHLGEGVLKDKQVAKRYFDYSCEFGDKEGCGD